jgi:Ca2+:H+ antiporter
VSRLNLLLIFVPVAVLAAFLGWSPLVIFASAALGIIPLAGVLGEATEVLAAKTGPRIGGLLNATLGNAAELIITITAIRAAQLELVRASIIGSILGNVLLVTGLSILLGGIKFGVQRFDRGAAGLDATLLILAVIALCVPSAFSVAIEPDVVRVEELSLATAAVILAIYILAIVHMLRSRTPAEEEGPTAPPPAAGPGWSSRQALAAMTGSVIGVVILSEFLVGAVEPVTQTLRLSPFFVGIIVIPFIGNVAEHLVAVQVALKDQMDLSLSVALGSSQQIALFVAPILVFTSLLLGHPLTLEFAAPEMLALVAAAVIAAFVAIDGQSNWLEGAMLLAVYLMLALGFFFLPGQL